MSASSRSSSVARRGGSCRGSSTVQVGVRLKPCLSSTTSTSGGEDHGARTPFVFAEGKCVRVESPVSQQHRDYAFDHVFHPTATNDAVAQQFVGNLVQQVVRGDTGAVLCYGQTGSGKTHTMGLLGGQPQGPGHCEAADENRGIVPFCLAALLGGTTSSSSTPKNVEVRLEFLQVYLDQVYDLFCAGKKLQLREVPGVGVMVEGSTLVEVESYADAAEILDLALRNRYVGEVHLRTSAGTPLAEIADHRPLGLHLAPRTDEDLKLLGLSKHLSSRSHVLLTLHVRQRGNNQVVDHKDLDVDLPLATTSEGEAPDPPAAAAEEEPEAHLQPGLLPRKERSRSRAASSSSRSSLHQTQPETANKWSRLVLVDLAGSERTNVGGNLLEDQERKMSEAKAINASLAALGNVVNSLAKSKSQSRGSFVPWRESKLTKLLWDAMRWPSRVRVLCTVSRERHSVSETVSTLGFAARCKKIVQPRRAGLSGGGAEGGAGGRGGVGGKAFGERMGEEVTLLRAEVVKLREEKNQLERLVQSFSTTAAPPAAVGAGGGAFVNPGASSLAREPAVFGASARDQHEAEEDCSGEERSENGNGAAAAMRTHHPSRNYISSEEQPTRLNIMMMQDPSLSSRTSTRTTSLVALDATNEQATAINLQDAAAAETVLLGSSIQASPKIVTDQTQFFDENSAVGALFLTSPPSPRGVSNPSSEGHQQMRPIELAHALKPPRPPSTGLPGGAPSSSSGLARGSGYRSTAGDDEATDSIGGKAFVTQFLEAVEVATSSDASTLPPPLSGSIDGVLASDPALGGKAKQVLDEIRGLRQYAAWQKNLSEDLIKHAAFSSMERRGMSPWSSMSPRGGGNYTGTSTCGTGTPLQQVLSSTQFSTPNTVLLTAGIPPPGESHQRLLQTGGSSASSSSRATTTSGGGAATAAHQHKKLPPFAPLPRQRTRPGRRDQEDQEEELTRINRSDLPSEAEGDEPVHDLEDVDHEAEGGGQRTHNDNIVGDNPKQQDRVDLEKMKEHLDAVIERRRKARRTRFTPYSAEPTPDLLSSADLVTEEVHVQVEVPTTDAEVAAGQEQDDAVLVQPVRAGQRKTTDHEPGKTPRPLVAPDELDGARSESAQVKSAFRAAPEVEISATSTSGAARKALPSLEVLQAAMLSGKQPQQKMKKSHYSAAAARGRGRGQQPVEILHPKSDLPQEQRHAAAGGAGSQMIAPAQQDQHSPDGRSRTSSALTASVAGSSTTTIAGGVMEVDLVSKQRGGGITTGGGAGSSGPRTTRSRPLPRIKLDLEATTKRMRSASRGQSQ